MPLKWQHPLGYLVLDNNELQRWPTTKSLVNKSLSYFPINTQREVVTILLRDGHVSQMSKQMPIQLKLQLWDEIILEFDMLYTEKELVFLVNITHVHFDKRSWWQIELWVKASWIVQSFSIRFDYLNLLKSDSELRDIFLLKDHDSTILFRTPSPMHSLSKSAWQFTIYLHIRGYCWGRGSLL